MGIGAGEEIGYIGIEDIEVEGSTILSSTYFCWSDLNYILQNWKFINSNCTKAWHKSKNKGKWEYAVFSALSELFLSNSLKLETNVILKHKKYIVLCCEIIKTSNWSYLERKNSYKVENAAQIKSSCEVQHQEPMNHAPASNWFQLTNQKKHLNLYDAWGKQ